MNAVSGTRRAIRELVDGTIRVMVDIDPPFRDKFFKLFPQIDMPIALAPLDPKALVKKAHQRTNQKEQEIGPLCLLAVQWCKDSNFWEWCTSNHCSWKGFPINEELAKRVICDCCGIKSRKELDTNPEAAHAFQEQVRKPYMEWLENLT